MKWKLGISKKYALFISTLGFIILAIILISMSIIIRSESATLKEKLREVLRVSYDKNHETMIIGHVQYFSYDIFNSLYHLDIKRINRLIEKLKAEIPVESVRIADTSGKVLTDGTVENPSFGKKLNTDISLLKSKHFLITHATDGHIVAFTIGLEDHLAGYGEILFSDNLLKNTIKQQDEIVFSIWKETQRGFISIALIGVLSILFFTVFLGLLFSRPLTSQLLKLRDATKRVAKGDLHYRLEVQSRDELGDLADSFNQMAEELLVTTVSKDYVDNIIKNMNDSLIVVSLDGTIKTVNQATLNLLSYPEHELLNQPLGIIFEDKKLTSEGAVLNDLMKEGSPSVRNIEKTYLSKDGRKIPVLLSGSVMCDGDGKIQGIVYVALDITERKQAEEELRKHREHLEELVKNRTIELTEINKQLQEEIDERNWAEESLIRSEEEARRLAQENAIMAEIGQIISSTLNIEEVYERFAEEVRKLIPSDRISISINNPEDSTVTIAYVTGVEIGDRRQGDTIPLTSSINKEIIRTRSGLLIQAEEEGELINRFPLLLTSFQAGFRSMMSVPLFSKDKMIGVLHLRSTKPNAYTERDLRIAERVGNQIAGAIANVQLFIERKRAEEALRESEEKYRTILENIEDGYFEVDITGNLTFFNDSLCRMLGYSRDELMGMNNRQYTDTENAKKLYQAFNKVYQTGESAKAFDWEVIRKDGAKRFGEVSISLIRDSKGQPIGFRGISRDITERKNNDEKILRQSALLDGVNKVLIEALTCQTEEEIANKCLNVAQALTKSKFGFIGEMNQAGRFDTIAMSDPGWEACRIPRSDSVLLINNMEIRGIWASVLKEERSLIVNDPAAHPNRVGTPEGHPLLTSFLGVPLKQMRKTIGMIALANKETVYDSIDQQDIETLCTVFVEALMRKRAEEALRKSEEKFREMYDNAPVGYHEYDTEGRITNVNRTDLEMLGYSREEMIGQLMWEFNVEEEIAHQQIMAKLAGKIPPGRGFVQTYRRKDGTTFPVLIEDRLLRDEKGRITSIRCTIQDITERKQAEEALQRSEEEARRLAQENAIMAEIGRIINSTLNIEEVYERFAEEVRKLLPFDRIAVNITNPDERTITVAYVTGVEIAGRRQGDTIPLAGSLNEEIIRTRSGLLIQTGDEGDLIKRIPNLLTTFQAGLRSMISIPLISKNEVIGVLHILSTKPNAYTEKDLRLAERVGNQIAGAIANAQLFTEHKRTEEALRESEMKFKDLYDYAPLGYHEYDTEGRITNVNRTDLEMLGYTAEEMIGQPIWKLNVNEETVREQVMAKLAGTLPPGKELERIYRRKDGTIFPVLIEDRLILDEKGRIKGIRSTIQDITGIKKTEEALRMSEEEAKRIAQENAIMAEIGRIISSSLEIDKVYEQFGEEVRKAISFDRILINIVNPEVNTFTTAYVMGIDVDGRPPGAVISWSGSATQEIFHSKSSLLIQTENRDELAACYPALLPHFQVGLRSFMAVPLFSKGNVTGVFHLQSTKPDAYTERDLRLAERVGNQIAGAIANAQLFAERVRAEQKAKSLEEQLRQSQKIEAVGQLAGGIAHDFNNLLTVVKGYSELSLLKLKEDDPLKGNIEEIHKASQRAADLTRQLLAFSRRQILEFKTLDLNIILQDMDKMLHRLIGEDIELVTLFAKDIGKVRTDPGQIEQVILNLAVNSRDAMPSGGKLTIETADVELDETHTHTRISITPGRYVMLSVSDTGCGMSPEVKEHLFEPFFTTKEKGKGTGLGLSTIYGIVKQSAGEIWVYSEPGQGTTFKIYLPRVDEEATTLHRGDDKSPLPQGRETVLIVEDEMSVRGLAVQVLRENGYNLLEAANGNEALRMAQEYAGEIHLLLTDVVMPQMGGKELADRLKPLRPDIKVLFTSGYTDNAIVRHGVLEPGIDFLQKPFSSAALAQKAREVLDR